MLIISITMPVGFTDTPSNNYWRIFIETYSNVLYPVGSLMALQNFYIFYFVQDASNDCVPG